MCMYGVVGMVFVYVCMCVCVRLTLCVCVCKHALFYWPYITHAYDNRSDRLNNSNSLLLS